MSLKISPRPFDNVPEIDDCHHQVDDDDEEKDDDDEKSFTRT